MRFLIKDQTSEKNDEEITENNKVHDFVKQKLAAQVQRIEKEPDISSTGSLTNNRKNDLEVELENERTKNTKLTEDLKKSVALINQMSTINLNKDLQIETLSTKLQSTTLKGASDEENVSLFIEYSGIFNKSQIKMLRSLKSGKPADSTFILNCVRFLYSDSSILNDISLTGRMFKGQKKTKMSDENVESTTVFRGTG